nr:hypothetical protein [Tanacetum cinerariifolium]
MIISVISVSLDSLKESVRTYAGRVIFFGTIPTTIPDTTPTMTLPINYVDTTLTPTEIPIVSPIVSPSLDYTTASPDYSPMSDTESDPSEDPSSDLIPPLPATSQFLSSTGDSLNIDTPDTPPSHTHARADLLPPPKRIRSFDSATDLEDYSNESSKSSVPRRTSLRDDIVVRDARVMVETVAQEEVKTSMKGPVEVRVDSVMHHAVSNDIPEPAQEETMPNIRFEATMTREVVDKLIARRLAKELETRDAARNLEVFALTWWNLHKRAIGIEATYGMTWTELMKLITKVCFLINAIRKMETEMVLDEEDKVERFIRGLPDNIQGNVIVAEPTRIQDAIRIANNLMDQKLKGYAKTAKNNRRFDNNPRDNRGDCTASVENQPGVVCYECGRPRHFRKDFPKLRNQKRGNKSRNKTRSNEAMARAHAIGR